MVLSSVLFMTSLPAAITCGATAWGWLIACLGLVFGLCLLPNSLIRIFVPPGQVTVDIGRHLRLEETLERPRPQRDISFAIVIAIICVVVFLAVRGAFSEPAVPGLWFGAGWWTWMGVNAVFSIDDWWQGWHVPERGARKPRQSAPETA